MATTATKKHHWTPEQAAEMGRRSGEARRARAEKRAELQAIEQAEVETFLKVDATGENLGESAREAAALIIGRILSGRVNCSDGRQAAALLAKCHEIARLESGQVTTLAGRVTLQVSEDDYRRRIEGVRASLDPTKPVVLSSDTTTPQVTAPPPSSHEADTPPPDVIELEDERPSA